MALSGPAVKVYDLLDADVFGRLMRRPKVLEEDLEARGHQTIVIDEIQKLPGLLDEVHRLIERKKVRFLLTGSSARKLKRGAANLLAGRAWEAQLFPLVTPEIPGFDLDTYLHRGGLPHVYTSGFPDEELASYVNLYLREEIQAEALTRRIEPFARFLDAVGLSNGEELSFEGLASDCGVPARTVQNYVGILEDTLVGFKLAPFLATRKRKAITRAKLYLFDVGVAGSLAQRGRPLRKSEAFGRAFEHFIVGELRAYLSYRRMRLPLQYWRSTSGFEVDAIVGKELAIECKASELVSDKHLRGLRALKEEGLIRRHLVVSLDPEPRVTADGIEIRPWESFLGDLWQDQLLSV